MLQLKELNVDVLLLIFEELKNDRKSLLSCLLVNRAWCATAVPILWRDPGRGYIPIRLFNTIILHLSEDTRNILKNQGTNNQGKSNEKYQRPLFNYISFWKYLELYPLESLISRKNIEESKKSIIRNEILKLFINKNAKFNHLSIPRYFDYQLHLIPGVECCLSDLKSFSCYVDIDQNILKGLVKICKSINMMSLYVNDGHKDYELCKLIEMQKNLNTFSLFNNSFIDRDDQFYKSLEESLIKQADTVQYLRIDWNISARFLSHFVNLIRLEIVMLNFEERNDENYLENLSLPKLKVLKTQKVPSKILVNLIENTKNLSEINIDLDAYNNIELIQAIYRNCPKLKYLKLSFYYNLSSFISEFENLLMNCQCLNGLFINLDDNINELNWSKIFEILTRSSPISLFKFKFYSHTFNSEDLNSFFDNWGNRDPMFLELKYDIFGIRRMKEQKLDKLIKQYKANGVIKSYLFGRCKVDDDFKWTCNG
jgi:hypothetical protein